MTAWIKHRSKEFQSTQDARSLRHVNQRSVTVHVRFEAHYGLKSDMRALPRWADFVVKVAGGLARIGRVVFLVLLRVRTRHLRCATDGSELKKDATNRMPSSRNARDWRYWRRPCDQLCEPAKVLGDRRQRELELGTARPT